MMTMMMMLTFFLIMTMVLIEWIILSYFLYFAVWIKMEGKMINNRINLTSRSRSG